MELHPGLVTDLRIAREVYGFVVDDRGRILSADNLGQPELVPEVLPRWSQYGLAARQLLDFCMEEYHWPWRLEWDGACHHGKRE